LKLDPSWKSKDLQLVAFVQGTKSGHIFGSSLAEFDNHYQKESPRRWNKMNTSIACLTITSDNYDALVTESNIPVVLDFWAPWCVPCNLMKRGVEKAAETLAGDVAVGLVNIDEQPAIVERFGIRGTPTFVVVRNGEVVQTFSGMATSSGLANRVKASLGL
jgi:thioredoxin 1